MKIEYTRKLPHKFFLGYTFFNTWNLKGAIPTAVLDQMKHDRDEKIREIETAQNLTEAEKSEQKFWVERKYFESFNEKLDKPHPDSPMWLKNPEAAQIVANRLQEFDKKYYHLIAYSVMANHVHAVFDFSVQLPKNGTEITDENYKQVHQVMKLINGGTAARINRILNRTGKVWSESYFDRYIRDEKHLFNAIWYTILNPVKAGICKEWTEHPYTYLAKE